MRKEFELKVVLGLVWAPTLLFLAYPLLFLLLKSFGIPGHSTLSGYLELFSHRQDLLALRNTVYVGLVTTLIATGIGVGMAWLITRSDLPGKGLLRWLVFLTFVTPPYIGTLGWIQLFGRVGWVNSLLTRIFGLSAPPVDLYFLEGIAVVMGIYLYPLVFWTTEGVLERMDPSFEEFAAVSGAGRWKVLTKVTLPLILPSILSAALLVFVRTVSCFAVAAALGLPARHYVLATRVYAALSHYDVRLACSLSVLLVLLSGGAFLLQRLPTRGRDYAVLTSEARRSELIRLGLLRLPLAIFVFTLASFAVLAPLFALLLTSLRPIWGVPVGFRGFTLENYRVLFRDPLIVRALRNSLLFSSTAATMATGFGFMVAYISARTKAAGRGTLEFLMTLPLAIPGPVLATGMILAFMRPPLALYNTPWIIIVAYLVAFTPFSLRTLRGPLQALGPELEEVAWTMGASRLRALKEVILPLLGRGVVTSWALVFLMGLREIPLSLMLHTQGTETVGVVLFSLRETLGVEMISALAVIVVFITLVGHLFVERLAGRMEGDRRFILLGRREF